MALRIVPIILFVHQIYQLLQAIRCQTSPDYSELRYGAGDRSGMLDWNYSGGWLHKMSSTILYGSSDQKACQAVGMSLPSSASGVLRGSFSLLWPTFLRICLSQLTETISCSLQQLPPATETALSIFEHSLAFAEAETLLYNALGMGIWGSSQPTTTSPQTSSTSTSVSPPRTTFQASATVLAITDAARSLSGPHILNNQNVPTEVLLVALLSCCNNLSTQIIAIFNRQRSLRLINTGIWAAGFVAAFIWGFSTVSHLVKVDAPKPERLSVSGLLHFPTVCILGFIPHLLILISMSCCAVVYLVALLLTALSLGSNPDIRQPVSFLQRFAIAHGNLQAALQLNGVSVKWGEDIYTAILRVGFFALTAASEAVFLYEGKSVEMRRFTWLEEDRLDEIQRERGGGAALSTLGDSSFHVIEEHGMPSEDPESSAGLRSGYAKERKLKKNSENGDTTFQDEKVKVYPGPQLGGVGAVQRGTKFYMLFLLWRGIWFLLGGWLAYLVGLSLDYLGVTRRPPWLRMLVGKSQKRAALERTKMRAQAGLRGNILDFWYLNSKGELTTPPQEDMDIEHEMRHRMRLEHPQDDPDRLQRRVDDKLYQWWKSQGWFGTRDDSGDYAPAGDDEDDDTTSVVFFSTSGSNSETGWEDESDGRRTPTQDNPFSTRPTQRQSTPVDSPLDAAALARLLDPPDQAAKDEARILAFHLSTQSGSRGSLKPGPVTRSQYRMQREREKSRIFFAGHSTASTANAMKASLLDPAEEARILESLIISRRHACTQRPTAATDAKSTFAAAGPLCVVCQASPRTIIAWPCRCLALCEDCRVSLALNNFGNCVTCRRNLTGFVRLWVP